MKKTGILLSCLGVLVLTAIFLTQFSLITIEHGTTAGLQILKLLILLVALAGLYIVAQIATRRHP